MFIDFDAPLKVSATCQVSRVQTVFEPAASVEANGLIDQSSLQSPNLPKSVGQKP
jgi:hypothetical protein